MQVYVFAHTCECLIEKSGIIPTWQEEVASDKRLLFKKCY